MDVYKVKNQSDGSIDKINMRILIGGDLQNKELVGDTWLPPASIRTLTYVLTDTVKHKARVYQLDLRGKFF